MKRLCLLLILICTLPSCAAAQWYLFPGNKKAAEKTTQRDTTRPARTDSVVRPAQDSLRTAGDTLLQEAPVPAWADAYRQDIPDLIRIGLILPFQASGTTASENFLDLYGGALIALRELGSAGLKAELQVYDSADKTASLEQAVRTGNDLLIGPVALADIQRALPALPHDKVLVSPLEPKAAELAADGPVVQSPCPWTAQIDEMVRWIREERMPMEEIYVVQDTAAVGRGEQSNYLMARLQESGIRTRNVLSVGEIPFAKGRKFRVVVASDRDSFLASSVRSLSIQGALNDNVVLYGTSRVRTNGTGPNDLHNVNAHLTSAYFIDYEDPAVRAFILAYRALFNNEPGSFAFQGYDTMRYFVTMCTKYGREWYKKLPEYRQKGLQSDFRFTEESPRINQAARRVVYNKDLTTTLLAG